MNRTKLTAVHPLEAWRCRECGYIYEEEEYILPIIQCPQCNSRGSFDRITLEREYHPGRDIMLLP